MQSRKGCRQPRYHSTFGLCLGHAKYRLAQPKRETENDPGRFYEEFEGNRQRERFGSRHATQYVYKDTKGLNAEQ